MKRLQILLFCFLSLPLASIAQMKVTGTVLDANSNEPLIGVTILEAQTDQEHSPTWMESFPYH